MEYLAKASLLRCTRGTASVEAVVALPTLILLLFGVLYVSRTITSKHEADDLARSCAWRYSASACADAPPGCESENDKVRTWAGKRDDDAARELETSWTQLLDMKNALSDGDMGAILSQLIAPVFGDALMQSLMDEAQSRVSYTVSREGSAGENKDLSATYLIPCNLKEQTVLEVAKDAWNSAIKSQF